jgi:hypothetical protein
MVNRSGCAPPGDGGAAASEESARPLERPEDPMVIRRIHGLLAPPRAADRALDQRCGSVVTATTEGEPQDSADLDAQLVEVRAR